MAWHPNPASQQENSTIGPCCDLVRLFSRTRVSKKNPCVLVPFQRRHHALETLVPRNLTKQNTSDCLHTAANRPVWHSVSTRPDPNSDNLIGNLRQEAAQSGDMTYLAMSFPSLVVISHRTPTGDKPASFARSTAASVCPPRTSTPPGWDNTTAKDNTTHERGNTTAKDNTTHERGYGEPQRKHP